MQHTPAKLKRWSAGFVIRRIQFDSGRWLLPVKLMRTSTRLVSERHSVRGRGPALTEAGNGVRTRDLDLGKIALFRLSYTRMI